MTAKKQITKKSKKIASIKGKNINTLSVIAAFALGIVIGYFIWGYSSSDVNIQDVAAAQLEGVPPAETVRRDIPTEGFPSEGPDDAPIVIIEFSDFQCPFCTKWHNETYLPLLEKYPDQIKLVYRNFPLISLHPDAYLAAEAAMCASDQNSYWAYHEKLFESEYGLDVLALREYAKELQLDSDTFDECIDSHKYQDFVQEDMDYAKSIGVQSTPTFYVNGQLVVGAQPLQVFEQIIQNELENAN